MQQRYLRNMQALSLAESDSLAGKHVAIAGCGGLGGYCIEELARIGVGRLTVIDCDVFEESNLNRQTLATVKTLGTPKAQAAKERIAEVNPLVTVSSRVERINRESAQGLIEGADCVIDALDNRQARFWLAFACQETGVPLVYGAIAGWYGQVCTVFPGDISFVNIYGSTEGEGIQRTEGNLPFTAAVTASLQTAEAIKVLLGKEDTLRNRLLMIDLLFASVEEMPLK